MRKTWDPTLLAILLAVAIVVVSVAATGGLAPGEWKGKLEGGRTSVHLAFRAAAGRGEIQMSFSVAADELEGFDAAAFEHAGAPLHLTWRRSAGAFVFEGEGGRRPRGSFRFDPDPAFVEGWRALGLQTPETYDLLALATHDVRLADVARLHELGYSGIDARDMIRLISEPDMIALVEGTQELQPRPDLDDLFRLRAHGVDADTLRSFTQNGLGSIGIDALVRVRDHGIDASFVRGMIDAGVDARDLDGILRLHSNGIDPDAVGGMRAAGLPGIGIDEQIRLRNHGVEAEYVRGMVESGLPDLSIDDLVRLLSHGVDTSFARTLVTAGPGKEGANAVILLHDRGMSEEWAREMAELGYGGTPPDQLVQLLTHGVSPELVRSLTAAGYRDLQVDDLIRAVTHGPESLGRPGAREVRPTS